MEQDLDTLVTYGTNRRTETLNTFTTSRVNRVDITSTTTRRHDQPPTSPLQILIQFNFSCKSLISYWVSNPNHPHDHPQLVRSDDSQPPEVRYMVICHCELLNHSKASLSIHQRLSEWFPFLPAWRPHWIDQVLERARDDVASMPASHNTVVVDLHVAVHHAILYYEGVGPVFEDAEGDNNNYMVPTTESWIESVVEKNKIVLRDSSGTCTVCLEDFSDGSEGVLLPCAHVFHGDCIGQWLRTSHYCPVCRFQLPTD